MKKKLAIVCAVVAAIAASVIVVMYPAQAATGFYVSDGHLYDAHGVNFVMRGVNHPHTWYNGQTTKALKDISDLGANSVRVVLSSRNPWAKNDVADVSDVISQCKVNKLICVLEVHDTTGFGENADAISLNEAVTYWKSIKSALVGEEKYIIINIGNEPYGNQSNNTWTADTSQAIKDLREAGFEHTIMVDAPHWGQDGASVMATNASTVADADPNKNTVFSVHMYGVYKTAEKISTYLNKFVTAKLPIVVGEFGHNHTDGDPDEDSIMSICESLGIGYLGWWWSASKANAGYLDMVEDFDPTKLTTWGERIFNGANGIKSTSKRSAVFTQSSQGPSSARPSSSAGSARPSSSAGSARPSSSAGSARPSSSPAVESGCSATYSVTNQWSGGFQGEVKVTAGSSSITSWTVTWMLPGGQSILWSWNTSLTTHGTRVIAKNMSYNGALSAGASTSFGFIGAPGSGGKPATVTCSVN